MRYFTWEEDGYSVKVLNTEEEIFKAYRLRHRIFSEILGWVDTKDDKLEVDEYDDFAIPFGVFYKSEMKAYIRLVIGRDYYMLEKDFRMLLDKSHILRKETDTVESSRFCMNPHARTERVSGFSISFFLLKGVYLWCQSHNIRYLYTVTEEKMYRLTKARGFTFWPVGNTVIMKDGTPAIAVLMDWKEFEITNTEKRPAMLRWFQSIRPSLSATATA